MNLEQKYLALLHDAEQRQLNDIDGIRLCFQTLSLAAAIDRYCATLLAPHKLSEGRFILLFLLDAAPNGLAPNQLAEKAGITRATVTGLLDGLQREDLIERKIDLQDRRALNIHLTPQGKQTAQQVIGQHSQWIASLFNHLSLSERHQLSTLLNKVSNGLKDNTP